MNKLEALLKYVSENNDFYKRLIKEYEITNPLDIIRYPMLTREDYQKNQDAIFSTEYKIEKMLNQLYTLSSSGTTGVPIETLWSPHQYVKSMMSLWRRRKHYYNISPNDLHFDFMLKYYNSVPKNKLNFTITGNTISVCRLNLDNENIISELCDLMNKYSPVWIQNFSIGAQYVI